MNTLTDPRVQARTLAAHLGPEAEQVAAVEALRRPIAAALHPLDIGVTVAVLDALLALVSQSALTREQRAVLVTPLAGALEALIAEADAPTVPLRAVQ